MVANQKFATERGRKHNFATAGRNLSDDDRPVLIAMFFLLLFSFPPGGGYVVATSSQNYSFKK